MYRSAAFMLCVGCIAGACTPYAVTTTARTLRPGEHMKTATVTVVPGGARIGEDSTGKAESIAMPGFDVERRFGLDERSDWGYRIPSMSGIIVSYKRRLTASSASDAPATALMVGGGMVNFLQHAHLDATLVTSGRETGSIVPYGGVRAIQVIPLSSAAVKDTPAFGAFGGLRSGAQDGGFSFELGVFYDESALKLRKNKIIVVPSIAVHGSALRRLTPW